ncbi:MAG: beta-ketoacyl synthase N-terminal-like domain-containing protein, partial [Rhodospirillaceae bacterium]|nr:beta-ketoacyl synthase N-terminal-like domain-containing protein [Rhodospirillaceae bacterium]
MKSAASNSESRRVVVTGLGMVTPLGAGVKGNWDDLIAGKSGIAGITRFAVDDLPCRIGGAVPTADNHHHKFVVDAVVTPKDRRRMDDFIVYALGAAEEAIKDSGWQPP